MALIEFKSRNYKKITIDADKIVAIVETKDDETMVTTLDPEFYVLTDEPVEEAVRRWNDALNGIQSENICVRNKRYKCDFCDYQTDDERECKKHEQEEHDSWAIQCVKSLRNYCTVKRRNNTCSKCQFFINCRCYLESQIPEEWKMLWIL